MAINELLDFRLAFRHINSDRRDDAFPDITGYREYKQFLSENLEFINGRITSSHKYASDYPCLIDIPKRGFTLRPGVVPQIDDRIVYQAIADLLSTHYIPEPDVYSNRLSNNNSGCMFQPGVDLWIAFQDKVEENCCKYPFVIETDITAYFDHINHSVLSSHIRDLYVSDFDPSTLQGIVTLLEQLLTPWCIGLSGFGIPQLNDASSFFSNLYMDEIDKWFASRGIVALRYVDDIRIFTNSEPDARAVLAQLIVKLREKGLYVASGKTKIRRSTDVLGELQASRTEMTKIESHIKTCELPHLETAVELLIKLFDWLISDERNFNDRQFRYCINRFKRLHTTRVGEEAHDKIIREVLNRLVSMPESTDVFVDYLSLFPDNDFIQQYVLSFLESPYSVYPWQRMQLLELLIRSNIQAEYITRVNQLACHFISGDQHPICKAKAYILRGKNGSYADRRDIRARYIHEDREDVRRAIIVSIQEMKQDERNHFYRSISPDSRHVQQTIKYVESLNEPTYFHYNPPNPYIVDNEIDSDDLTDLGSEYFI